MTKICNTCNVEYPATSEYFHKRGTGLRPYCKICRKIEGQEYRKANSEKVKEQGRAWRQANKQKHVDRVVAWRKANPEKTAAIQKKSRLKMLGFTPELFDQMIKAQGNLCALCGTDQPGGTNNTWNADHDHNTGKARGLLCMSCNISLGHIEAKDSDWLNKAKKYIEQGGFFSDNSQEIVTQKLH